MRSNKGMTLIELLAVIVILAILAVIAVVLFGNVIQRAKQDAIVANAIHLSEAARYYDAQHLDDEVVTVTYRTLVEEGFLEKIKDPDSEAYFELTNSSFVRFTHQGIRVCYIGTERKLCDEEHEGLLVEDLTLENIQTVD